MTEADIDNGIETDTYILTLNGTDASGSGDD